jgi:hypothetical protein
MTNLDLTMDAITLEEFIGNPKDRNVPALTKRFRKLDSNKDGKLLLDELKNLDNEISDVLTSLRD